MSPRADSLLAHLSKEIGIPGLMAAIGLGGRGPSRKPVLQLIGSNGESVGFAKLGWNASTRHRVANEATALIDRPPGRLIATPAVIHRGPWGDLEITVVGALPQRVRRFDPRSAPRLDAVREVAGPVTTRPLADSPYVARLARRVEATRWFGDAAAREVLELAVATMARRPGQVDLPFASWHGDWVPWNIARDGSRLWVIDWEHHARDVPVGLDVLHFRFQVESVMRRSSLAKAVDAAAREAGRSLSALGVVQGHREVLLAYLVELLLRTIDASKDGGWLPTRLYPGLIPMIRRVAE